ncbi:MAG: cell division protein FtsB [Arenicellales bacterium WSBS_2016_MAG_OTU3]
MKLVLGVIISLFLSLQFSLWFGDKGAIDLYSLHKKITKSSEDNQKLQERHDRLHYEIVDLKDGTDAIEERARADLGLIKRGETFYQIISP